MTEEDGGFRKLSSPVLAAPLLSGIGEIGYTLWADKGGNLCIQMLKSTGGGKAPDWHFQIESVVADLKKDLPYITGWKDGVSTINKNANCKGFLRAIVHHLLLRKI